MTPTSAARIQSAVAKANGGPVAKGSFAPRAQAAAARGGGKWVAAENSTEHLPHVPRFESAGHILVGQVLALRPFLGRRRIPGQALLAHDEGSGDAVRLHADTRQETLEKGTVLVQAARERVAQAVFRLAVPIEEVPHAGAQA